MYFEYWFMLFSVAAFANMLGLNISSSFNSNVTIYILIPLLMIPQMILGGAMFSFDKLNRDISSIEKVPFIAEVMVTKWAYEGLMVHQFKDNEFEKYFFDIEKVESKADFKQVYYLPELNDRLDILIEDFANQQVNKETLSNLRLLYNEFSKQHVQTPDITFQYMGYLHPDSFDVTIGLSAQEYLQELDQYYGEIFQEANSKRERLISYMLSKNAQLYRAKRDVYHNERVSEIVKKIFEKNKIVESDHELYQQVDPIYQDPLVSGFFDFRSHFYAPRKHFMGGFFDTFWFNVLIIWVLSLLLYVTLYYDALKKLLELGDKVKFKK